MMTRRDVFKACAAGAILYPSVSVHAQAQQKRKAKTKSSISRDENSAPTDGQTDGWIGELLAGIRVEYHLPGFVGGIMKGARLAASGSVGIRKIGATESIQVSDQMHMGSCTKPMTATMIGSLVEEGKLSWNSTFRKVFPESASELHPQFREVTLSHLLTHRAGLPHDGAWWDLPGATTTQQRHALMMSMLERAPLSRPGSTYAYSNVGYALAGLMAERVTGEAWESLMRKRLFEPLEMTSAGFGTPGQSGLVTQPWGHHLDGRDIRPTQTDNAPSMGPAGTVHCSIPDLAKFAALHLTGERGSSKLLKPATLKTLHIPPPGCQYAGGWTAAHESWAGGMTLSHNGSNTSWYTTIWLAPARNFATLVATNQGDKQAEKACEEASRALIRAADRL